MNQKLSWPSLESLFDIKDLESKIQALEKQTLEEDFWNDSDRAQKTIGEMNDYKSTYDEYSDLRDRVEDLEVMIDLSKEEDSLEYLEEIALDLVKLELRIKDFNTQTLLSGEFDKNYAVLSIHAGAGGLEAQDWAKMLYRMYDRWLSARGFSKEVVSYNSDTEGGIKSVVFRVIGKNAYGLLKSEKGVHRLVRISPFDTSRKRHTSFASIDVIPELDDSIEIDIDPSDLKIDTFRASGAGGQHVNTTDSAVRISHIPTGVVVTCQNERSQIMNREVAMRMLYSKLLQIAQDEQKEKIEDIQGKYNQIGWGSQIRSYVFHPYQMVKDHRTDYEVGDISSVMDGDIDGFISEYLNMKCSMEPS